MPLKLEHFFKILPTPLFNLNHPISLEKLKLETITPYSVYIYVATLTLGKHWEQLEMNISLIAF
jgi:hypothetical protein